MLAALEALEAEWKDAPLPVEADELTQAGVTVAVAWAFIQLMVPDRVPAAVYPRLVAYSAAAEQLGVFRELPMDAV